MKRKFLLLLFFGSVNVFAQNGIDTSNVNKIIIDEASGKPMLIGLITPSAFEDTSFSWWYDSEYKNYEVGVDTLKPLFEDSTLLKNVNIKQSKYNGLEVSYRLYF